MLGSWSSVFILVGIMLLWYLVIVMVVVCRLSVCCG